MRKIFTIIFCLLISNIVISQNPETPKSDASSVTKSKSRHEFSIYGAGGISNLSYKFDGGSVGGKFGGGAGVGYTCNISANFGIATGIGFASYGSKVASDAFSEQYNTPDDAGDDFRFGYSVAGYEEQQSATLLTIPVLAQYRHRLYKSSMSFYAAGGIKLGLPVSAITTINRGIITTTGYYAYEDQTYENLPQHAFVTGQAISKQKTDIDLGVAAILSLEAGLRFSLSNKQGLYTGLFFDYGLNNIQKSKNKHVVEYHPSQFRYNSVLNTGMVDKINLMSVGIKVKLGIRN